MIYPFDLHVHSSFSDGDYSPRTIMKKARASGMREVVIADHNIVNHFKETNVATREYGFEPIQGIEISTSFKEIDLHILGYSLNFNSKILSEGLKETIAGMHERMRLMIAKIKKIGIALDFNSLKKKKGKEGAVFKYDLIKEVAKRKKISIPKATQMFNRGGPLYVPYSEKLISPIEAVQLIHRARGLAVLAHPFSKKRSFLGPRTVKDKVIKLIEKLISYGLKGIEVNSPYHELKDQKRLELIAKKYKLLITGGSDYHGEIFMPQLKLGRAGIKEKDFQKFLKALKSIK